MLVLSVSARSEHRQRQRQRLPRTSKRFLPQGRLWLVFLSVLEIEDGETLL
jgi:hypothetical protein